MEQIVSIRDALGHGRVFALGPVRPDAILRLMKFSQAVSDGMVTVTMSIDMTEAWFDETIAFLGLATSIRGLVVSIRDTNSVNPWSAPVNGSNIRSSIARLSGTKTPLSDRMAPKLE